MKNDLFDTGWQKLSEEVGAWSRRNFPRNTPLEPFEGVSEEIGELMHARLKGRQGIRGTRAEREEHEDQEQDALGDCMIFLLDLCARLGHVPEVKTPRKLNVSPDSAACRIRWYDGCLAASMEGAMIRKAAGEDGDRMDAPVRKDADVLANALADYAHARGWDLEEIARRTWDSVKARDWIAYPDTGLPPETDKEKQTC